MGFNADDLPDPEDFDLELDDLKLATLAGDLRDRMLTPARQMRKLWPSMSEIEQQDFANSVEQASRDLVRKVVQMFTDRPFPRIVLRLGDLKVIGGEKARLESKITTFVTDEYLSLLGKAVGKEAVMFLVSADEFLGQKGPAQVDPDEPPLPLPTDEGDGPEDPDGGSPDGESPTPDDGLGGEPGLTPDDGEQEAGPADTDQDGVAPDDEAGAQTEADDVAAIAAEAFPGATVVTYPDGEGPADVDQIRKDADDFEASAAELESQVTRAKFQAERDGGTTEPVHKPRRSRKTVAA